MLELVTKAYRNSFFNETGSAKIASGRSGNVIVEETGKRSLIPDIFKSFKEKNPVIIRYPNAIRPWRMF